MSTPIENNTAGLQEILRQVNELPENGSGGSITPQMFGAVGDGVADDTEAVAAAIAALNPGDTLYFPEGVYRVSNIDLKSNMTVRGDGWCSVIQLLDATTDYHARNNCLNIENVENIIIRDIKLDGTRPTQKSTAPSQDGRLNGLHIRYASDIYVENVWMYNNGYHGCIMTYATNVVFSHCKATDNGFRPIHGHTQIYNCGLSNCVCENNGLGLTGGSGYENDSIFFFGAQYLVINDNIVKSNRRGCITVGCDQESTAVADRIPTRNITISGNVCECYADLPYVPSEESDTGVAKFSSMGILVYGGDAVLENVSITGNTIKNAHEAIRFYAQENNVCSINAVVSGNAIIDCSYGVWAVEVEDVTVSNNQFRNLACAWMYMQTCRNFLINGNSINAPGTSEYRMCRINDSNGIIVQNNRLIGDCANAIYAPDSNKNVVVINNTLSGFTDAEPIVNTNGHTEGNICIAAEASVEKICIDPYKKSGFVRPTLANPSTSSANYRYTTPVEITEADVLYELNTYFSVPNEYANPSQFDYSPYNLGIVFLAGTELSAAVGIVHPSNSNGTVTFSESCIAGDTKSIWGIQLTITAEKVKELFPTATHVMMEVQKTYADPDNLPNDYKTLNDGHAYVYRE